jgi:5-methylcytosine-specific restriction endonuclease McrA
VPQHTVVCATCGETFHATRAGRKYCRPLCARRAYTARRKADGRLSEYRHRAAAKRSAYMATNRPRWNRQAICEACGDTRRTSHPETRTCSGLCERYIRYGCWPSSPVSDTHPSRSTPVPTGHPSRDTPLRARFAASRCISCATWFVVDRMAHSNLQDRACSRRCGRRYHRSLRRVRRSAAARQVVRRLDIYVRDGWRCQLCGRRVRRDAVVPHPLAPTLDHVLPLSAGGSHEPSNVQCAHFICNARKGNRATGEQLALLG